jgi:predicted TIM-barrel fold metal-dependent hydrolase
MTARSYAHAHTRPEWLALVQEEPMEPALPIVDPHHHFWHLRESGRYMPEQLHEDLAAGHNVLATVFLQCGWMHRADGPEAARPAGETEAVNAAAVLSATGAYGPARVCAGIVGYADLRRPDLDAALDAHVAAAPQRFRGIRQVAAYDPNIAATSAVPPPAGLMLDPAFAAGFKRLGARGFTFDSWAYHTQLADLLAVVQQAPETKVVVNHVGGPLHAGPYRRDEVFATWKNGMAALAACPNVYVKLGGLGMPVNGFDYHNDPLPPGSAKVAADWKPYIETCIALFGPGRAMFESNFPVDKGMVGYTVLWNAFKRLAAGASDAEKAALFHDTATAFYRL